MPTRQSENSNAHYPEHRETAFVFFSPCTQHRQAAKAFKREKHEEQLVSSDAASAERS